MSTGRAGNSSEIGEKVVEQVAARLGGGEGERAHPGDGHLVDRSARRIDIRTVTVMGTTVRLIAPMARTERGVSDPMGLRSSAGHIRSNIPGLVACAADGPTPSVCSRSGRTLVPRLRPPDATAITMLSL